jgi:hypothetical protein
MGLSKELGVIVTAVLLLSSLGSYVAIMNGSVRMVNGDPSGATDIGNAVADEVVGTVQWSLGVYVVILIAGALGLTSVVAWLKRYC